MTSGAWETANNLGNVLIRRGRITQAQLADALDHQHNAHAKGVEMKLGEACIVTGACTKADIDDALAEQRHNLAPACNEGEVQDAFASLDRVVKKATKTSSKLQAVSLQMERRATGNTR